MELITGGTGFIGSHLALELLREGRPVRLLIRSNAKKDMVRKTFMRYGKEAEALFDKIEWAEGDINDLGSLEDAMEGIHTVFHCAAMVALRSDLFEKMQKVNVEGTANVVNLCTSRSLYLCHLSSCAVFGYHPHDTLVHEELKWKGDFHFNYYATTKYNGEMEVWRGIEEGLKAVIVNPSVVLGPCDWNTSSGLIFRRGAKGIKVYPPGTKNYVDVRDLVKIMRLLTDKNIQGERFLISSESLPLKTFVSYMASAFGYPPPVRKIGPFGIKMLSWLDRLRSFLTGVDRELTPPIVEALTNHTFYSSEKIKKYLDYRFIPVKDSVNFTVEHYKKEMGK